MILMHTLDMAPVMSTTGYAYALIHTSIMQYQKNPQWAKVGGYYEDKYRI